MGEQRLWKRMQLAAAAARAVMRGGTVVVNAEVRGGTLVIRGPALITQSAFALAELGDGAPEVTAFDNRREPT